MVRPATFLLSLFAATAAKLPVNRRLVGSNSPSFTTDVFPEQEAAAVAGSEKELRVERARERQL